MLVTILITAGLLALVAYAFKVFWREILYFAANAVVYAADVIEKFIIFVRKNAKAVAYVVKHYKNGRKTKTSTEEEIDIELCPDEVQDALNKGYDVKVHNIN